ncbi:hypothetical protein NC653_033837 [Populus alba x Populus x berolinensis]|uniref:Uncharacterized protein n=1 Tax=Populus alba x Populus x berolinensis TaxID=444605 RepID=A0AAD6LUM3_9ROSI|nr:hypothetical protein NC653_033837 [Populus alba x Populus x berolinensis]
MDSLLGVKDENGRKLTYEEIINEEQKQIVKKWPSTQKGLSVKEVREMDYLFKLIDETLRLFTFLPSSNTKILNVIGCFIIRPTDNCVAKIKKVSSTSV